MESNIGGQQQQQQELPHYIGQGLDSTKTHRCDECGLLLNSPKSLEVHLQYHKENLLKNWAVQATSNKSEESNNNNTKANMKRELISNNTVGAPDSSDSILKRSPEYSSATPDNMFGHPPTPQSYQSETSPFQNGDNQSFVPNFQNFQIKPERTSPVSSNHHQQQQQQQSQYQASYANYVEQQYYPMDSGGQPFNPDPFVVKASAYRYHPYGQPQTTPYEQQVASTTNATYPPQPTPSPSPKQCDKCGFVCESASQLIEHINIAHTPYQTNQHFMFKQEEAAQSDILDLDSHKVVHNIYTEEVKHPVNAMLGWSPPQKVFQQPEQRFVPESIPDVKLFQQQEYVTAPQLLNQQGYRPFEPTAMAPTPVAAPAAPAPSGKGANWKSNEARRPKTYNCTACNKWFTSSGHLKRHYNTTLHKNAVKSSGHPDPATLPISAHHHPARDNPPKQEESPRSNNSVEEARAGEESNSYERAPPMGHYHQPPVPMTHSNLSPNGDAGLSTSLDSRGLLQPSVTAPHGFPPMQHLMMDNGQFQMYPNELAPHVTEVMDTTTSNLSTTGDYHHQQQQFARADDMPLPSFSQFQKLGVAAGYDLANVGGMGSSPTTPYAVYCDTVETKTLMYRPEGDEYKIQEVGSPDATPEDFVTGYSPRYNNNNNGEELSDNDSRAMEEAQLMDIRLEAQPQSPEKAHTKRDLENKQPKVSPAAKKTTVHKCYDCDKFFNKACYLTQHNKTFHSGDKPFKCSRCGKRFPSSATYTQHHSKHAGDKPHKCSLCPKQFNHKTDLRRHMCLHTGQKPYACEICGKGFIRKDHMMKHCETHLRKSQSKISMIR